MVLLKRYIRFCYGNQSCSHIADTTFCQFLKLENDIMRYNKLAKMVTKGTSICFEMCMLPLMYQHYLCERFYL